MNPHWPKVQQWQRDDSMLDGILGLLQQSFPETTRGLRSLLADNLPVEKIVTSPKSLLADNGAYGEVDYRLKPYRPAPSLLTSPTEEIVNESVESVPEYITETLEKEGGYQSSREDKGNWTGGKVNVGRNLGTNFGITPRSWAEFLIGDGKGVDPESKEFKDKLKGLDVGDMRDITEDQAIDFYKKRADKQFKINRYPLHLQNQIFDIMTHGGYRGGMELLQEAAGAEVDGLFGIGTLNALQNLSNEKLANTRLRSFSQPFIDEFPGVIPRALSFAKSSPEEKEFLRNARVQRELNR